MENVKKHLALLGKKVIDKVTEFSGVAESVCFDLYGCIQVCVCPVKGEDGKLKDSHWFDASRLIVDSDTPVMPPPNLDYGAVAEGLHGPAHKPSK